MTYFITAYSNDRARLIQSETRTTAGDLVDLIVSQLKSDGFIVEVREEA